MLSPNEAPSGCQKICVSMFGLKKATNVGGPQDDGKLSQQEIKGPGCPTLPIGGVLKQISSSVRAGPIVQICL